MCLEGLDQSHAVSLIVDSDSVSSKIAISVTLCPQFPLAPTIPPPSRQGDPNIWSNVWPWVSEPGSLHHREDKTLLTSGIVTNQITVDGSFRLCIH